MLPDSTLIPALALPLVFIVILLRACGLTSVRSSLLWVVLDRTRLAEHVFRRKPLRPAKREATPQPSESSRELRVAPHCVLPLDVGRLTSRHLDTEWLLVQSSFV